MRPKKYPYQGIKKTNKITKEDELELVVFPNISLRKDILKHVFSVVRDRDHTTIIYFRIPNFMGLLGYEEQRATVNLSYKETIKILNDVN